MVPYIERYEPGRHRLRIKSKRRLVAFLLLILLAFLAIFIPIKGAGQINYIKYRVAYGDTYWEIAKSLQGQGYRPKADIRDIVSELVEKSDIRAHELKDGDTIYLPDIKGD